MLYATTYIGAWFNGLTLLILGKHSSLFLLYRPTHSSSPTRLCIFLDPTLCYLLIYRLLLFIMSSPLCYYYCSYYYYYYYYYYYLSTSWLSSYILVTSDVQFIHWELSHPVMVLCHPCSCDRSVHTAQGVWSEQSADRSVRQPCARQVWRGLQDVSITLAVHIAVACTHHLHCCHRIHQWLSGTQSVRSIAVLYRSLYFHTIGHLCIFDGQEFTNEKRTAEMD